MSSPNEKEGARKQQILELQKDLEVILSNFL